jgi:hypothetical protein
MGRGNRSDRSATATLRPIACQRNTLGRMMQMVVVVRPSPRLKKRPAATGLFLFQFAYPPFLSATRALAKARPKQRISLAPVQKIDDATPRMASFGTWHHPYKTRLSPQSGLSPQCADMQILHVMTI